MHKLAFLIFALLIPATAAFGQEARPLDERDGYATVMLVLPPEYPPDAVKEGSGKSIEVAVSGTVGVDGRMVPKEFTMAQRDERFIAAVRAVLPEWRFVPAVDDAACSAKVSEASVLVWFDIKDGKPAISVSVPEAAARAKRAVVAKQGGKLTFRDSKAFVYPEAARQAGVEGKVIALAKVDGQGQPTEVSVLAHLPATDIFDGPAIEGIRQAKYVGGEAGKAFCAQIPMMYCLGGRIGYPLSACDGRR